MGERGVVAERPIEPELFTRQPQWIRIAAASDELICHLVAWCGGRASVTLDGDVVVVTPEWQEACGGE